MQFNRRGQVSAEMAVLFTFVVTGLIFMGVYLQRAAQGGVKSNADGLGQQFSTISASNSISRQHSKSTVANTITGSCSDYSHGVGGAGAAGVGCATPTPGGTPGAP